MGPLIIDMQEFTWVGWAGADREAKGLGGTIKA